MMHWIVVTISALLISCSHSDKKEKIQELIPITMANLRGHQDLYNHGFWFISSSKGALLYVRENAGQKTAARFRHLADKQKKTNTHFRDDFPVATKESIDHGKSIISTGHDISKKTLYGTHDLATAQFSKSKEWAAHSWDALADGYGNYSAYAAASLNQLAHTPSNFGDEVVTAHSWAWQKSQEINQSVFAANEDSWSHGLKRASAYHAEGLASSKKQSNSLTALFPLLGGQFKALYYGVLAPGFKSISRGTVQVATTLVALPVTSVAATSWYAVKNISTGCYHIAAMAGAAIVPPIESAVYATGSLLSLGTVPITYAVGSVASGVNEAAFATAGVTLGASEMALRSLYESGKYGAISSYHLGGTLLGTTYDQLSSAAVISYNVATAAPVHSLMAVGDAAVFAFWDGPRLGLAVAKGEI